MTATLLHDIRDQDASARVPAPILYALDPPTPPRRRRWWALDRTAVLALGVLAGFLIGVSFNAAGRAAIWATMFPDDARPVALIAALPPAPALPARPGAIDPSVVRRVATDGEIRVGVFGDSFGSGLWAGLYHQLPEKRHFQVFRFGKEATGFTRYRTLNLEDRARDQVAHQPIDVAVISYGANDIQPIFAEGHLRLLMSDGWQRIIGERIDRFVRVARSTGASVYWIGLPAMQDPALDANVVALSNLGTVGIQMTHLARVDDTVLGAELREYRPDLIVVAFGTNEAFSPSLTPAGFENAFRVQVARLRRFAPGVPMLLFGAPDSATRRADLRAGYQGCDIGPRPAPSLAPIGADQPLPALVPSA